MLIELLVTLKPKTPLTVTSYFTTPWARMAQYNFWQKQMRLSRGKYASLGVMQFHYNYLFRVIWWIGLPTRPACDINSLFSASRFTD